MSSPFHKPITGVQLVQPKRKNGGVDIVLLDRIEPGVTPEYCIHGQTACFGCNEWCWLGDKTYEVVASGGAAPLCMQCAHQMIPRDVEPKHNIRDHRRADGPH
jgi:hypothetical protein